MQYLKKNYDGKLEISKEGANDPALEEVRLTADEFRNLMKNYQSLQRKLNLAEEGNKNLMRIARERANASRGITPKKEHSGYIIMSSRQWTEHLQGEEVIVWKSVLQTPFDASMTFEPVSAWIEDELWHVLGNLGCELMNDSEDNGVYEESEENIVYKWSYIANYKTGLWEVEFFTNHSLEVSEDMRPQSHRKSNSK